MDTLVKKEEGIFSRSTAIFSILCLLTVLSMFYRISTAVIAPNLILDLSLNAEKLGLLGSVFFFAFAFMQLPMGLLLDHIGPRIVITCFAIIGAAGSFLFAIADSYPIALIARILLGIGMAPMLMGTFKVLTLLFPANVFSTLAGFAIAAGTLGNMLGASPLAYLASIRGWRIIFAVAGGITFCLGGLNYFALRNLPHLCVHQNTKKEEGALNFVRSAKLILGSLAFWQIGTATFFRYGTYVSLQGLWFGLYLMDAKHLLPIDAGNILLMLSVGYLIGCPTAGRISDRSSHSTKAITLAGLTMYCMSLFPLSGFWSIESKAFFMLLAFFIGFFSAFGILLYTHTKELFPLSIAATAMAWVNFFLMLGGAVLTSVFGRLIELFPHSGKSYPAEAYQLSFIICFLSMAMSLIFYAFSKKSVHVS